MQSLGVHMRVTDSSGKPAANASVDVVAVDEGICQLTNFKTPDPFAFFYAALHFTTWIGLDQGALWPYILPEAAPDEAVTWDLILRDIAKRPYITVGFTGFVLMIPLALTSTAGWIRRLGGRWWNRLHRLVYVTGICGVVHFLWLVKVVETEQIAYAVILAVLLGLRLWWAIAKRLAVKPVAARRTVSSPG